MTDILEQLIADRNGIVRHSELLAAGLSRREVQAQIEAKVWRPAGRTLLVHHSVPACALTDTLVAAAQYPGAALTGVSAALLRPHPVWAGRTFPGSRAMLIAPPHVTGNFVRVQHPGAVTTIVQGYRVADLHTTLVDLLRFLPPGDAGAIAGAANQQSLTSIELLEASVKSLKGYPGAPQLARLVRAMADGAESGPEIDLHGALHAAGIRNWVANPTLTINGEDFRPDIAFAKAKIALEYDGLLEHSGKASFYSDRQRDFKFQFVAGWLVARLTSQTLYNEAALADFLADLRAVLRSRGHFAA